MQIEWTETGGPEIPRGAPKTRGTGSRIVEGVIAGAGGTVERDWQEGGLKVMICMPISKE